MGAGLIHKDQIVTGEATGGLAPGRTLGFFLLAGFQDFFFWSSPEPVWPA
jgi:hypothetical protein